MRTSGQRRKYNNVKCHYNGITFDSKKELARYKELRELERIGIISQLEVHKSFKLILPNGKPVIIRGLKKNTTARFLPDFVYKDQFGKTVVEDVKSPITAKEKYFRLKKAIFEAIYGLEVRIV